MAKILLVDDDRDLASLTRMTLVAEGHEVFVCHYAASAIEKAKQEKPDLILMDILLPEVSGAEAVINLQEVPALADIPVVFLTGLVSNQEQRGLTVRGHNYKTLGKPFEVDQLLKVVESYCGE